MATSPNSSVNGRDVDELSESLKSVDLEEKRFEDIRNPVGELQELMMLNKREMPEYTEIDPKYDGVFVIYATELKALNQVFYGEARSKKGAKKNAAIQAIKAISAKTLNITPPTPTCVSPSSSTGGMSSYSGTTFHNPVGSILELCSPLKIKAEFNFLKKEGMDHNLNFAFECVIPVFHLRTIGVGKSKKEAKVSSAQEMLNKLKEEQVIERYKANQLLSPTKLHENWQLNEKETLFAFFNQVHSLTIDDEKIIKQVNNYSTLLEQFAIQLNLKINYDYTSNENEHCCLVRLKVEKENGEVITLISSVGSHPSDLEEAKNEAFFRCLCILFLHRSNPSLMKSFLTNKSAK